MGSLRKINRSDLRRNVWQGVTLAILLSGCVAVVMNLVGSDFSDAGEATFEGLTMFLAACILTWMIFWMQNQSIAMKGGIETNVRKATQDTSGRGLFFLSFFAVVREGVELSFYLLAVRLSITMLQTGSGALLGLMCAIGLGWLLTTTTHRFNLSRFFRVTNILLILFAAGLIVNGTHELIESGWIPVGMSQVWNMNGLLAQNSTVGQILNALVGYNSQPSLTEVLVYLGYLVAITSAFLWNRLHFTHRYKVADHR